MTIPISATNKSIVCDTSSLITLTLPWVLTTSGDADGDGEPPSGDNPLARVLKASSVYVPGEVMGELSEHYRGEDDALAHAAKRIIEDFTEGKVALCDRDQLDIQRQWKEGKQPGVAPHVVSHLDTGEVEVIRLAKAAAVDWVLIDEINVSNAFVIRTALRETSVRTHATGEVVCALAQAGKMHNEYAKNMLRFLREKRGWDADRVQYLEEWYL